MKDMGAMMRQAQAMQQKLADAQAKLAQTVVEGVAGNGLVKVALAGSGELRGVTIDPSLLDPDEAEMLGDLIVAAHASAKKELDDANALMMRQVMGPLAGMPGMPSLPGMKF
jgi:DNA-binding YbaB/EbfC family protein